VPWQELSDASAALVGCGHVSGVNAADVAAGPNALRGSGPNRSLALESALTQGGSPDPRNNRICITSSYPGQLMLVLPIYLLPHLTVVGPSSPDPDYYHRLQFIYLLAFDLPTRCQNYSCKFLIFGPSLLPETLDRRPDEVAMVLA